MHPMSSYMDYLHVVDLGVAMHLCGNVLHLLCYDVLPGTAAANMSFALPHPNTQLLMLHPILLVLCFKLVTLVLELHEFSPLFLCHCLPMLGLLHCLALLILQHTNVFDVLVQHMLHTMPCLLQSLEMCQSFLHKNWNIFHLLHFAFLNTRLDFEIGPL